MSTEVRDGAAEPVRKKILIEALHGMGDVVCMLPLMREVREAYPDAHITVLVKYEHISDIVRLSGLNIDEITAIDAHADVKKFLKFCLNLRKRKFDISISAAVTPVKKARLMMYIVGAKKKAGIQFSMGKNYAGLDDKYHFVDANLLILEQLGLEDHHYSPKLYPSADDINNLSRQISGAAVGVCIGMADTSFRHPRTRSEPIHTKGWGNFDEHVKNMSELISGLLEKNFPVVLIGGKNEIEIFDAIPDDIKSKCLDFVGKTTVAQSAAIASLCAVTVGVDTGMQHIADAVGTRTVSLFGPTGSKTRGAYSDKALFAAVNEPCAPCIGTDNYVNCADRKCMKKITPEQVLELIEESLRNYK